MIHRAIKIILISLFIFTPIAFGSMDIWAFSLMELGILLIISLYSIQELFFRVSGKPAYGPPLAKANANGAINLFGKKNISALPLILLFLFLAFILFQLIPLPSELRKFLSPKTFELRQQLLSLHLNLPSSSISILHPNFGPLSLFPFATQIEFFKWFSLVGFFLFLVYGRLLDERRIRSQLILVIFLVGVGEAFYGMIEFLSGHRHILSLDMGLQMPAVTGTFINRNYFTGYLLMVIPLSMGFLLSRLIHNEKYSGGWRNILSYLEGKDLLVGFGLIVMVLGLFLSASRMGITSLLLSLSMLSILFNDRQRGKWFSKTPILVVGLALLWAAWIGLDAVISGFFGAGESLKMRWIFWVDTFQILRDFPFFGSGLGTFPQVFPMYRSFHIQGVITHAENDLLQIASEVGLIGISVLLFIFLYLFNKVIHQIRSLSTTNQQFYVSIGALVGILSLMVHSLVERNILVPANSFLYIYLWANLIKIFK